MKGIGISHITHITADGGVVKINPSPYAGTWAWIATNAAGIVIAHESGIIPAPCGGTVSNNLAEFVAAVKALTYLPDGWSGKLCSDSQITLGRLCWGWKITNIPAVWSQRAGVALRRLGTITPVLLQGHPTPADLEAGIGKRNGYPVSQQNYDCDKECTRLARAFLEQLPALQLEASISA